MKRSAPMKRTRMRRRPRVSPELIAGRARVLARAQGRCEVVLDTGRCPLPLAEVHHVVKRSHFSPKDPRRDDPSNLLGVCTPHHALTDMPFKYGRLQVTSLGDEQFRCRIVTAPDKFAARDPGRGPSDGPNNGART